MRMRKKNNLQSRMDACSEYWIQNPETYKGRWRELKPDCSQLRVEVGCGKGKFTVETAAAEPDMLLIAVEIVKDAMVVGMEKAKAMGLKNVFFISMDVAEIENFFEESELDLLYINFCDPWPRSKNAKRRLTYHTFLDKYRRVLKLGGQIHFKTDNAKLFEFSLEEFARCDLEMRNVTRNLHENGPVGIMTGYEEKFYNLGTPINRCECIVRSKPANTMDVIIFAGQSNMQGETERLSEAETVKDAYEYKWLTNKIVPLRNPVGENIKFDGSEGWALESGDQIPAWLKDHVFGASCYGNTNLVPSFCRAYIDQRETSVLAVHTAKGSSVIDQWAPGAEIYSTLVQKANAAIKKAKREHTIGHIYVVWLQGESDAISGTSKDTYKQKLAQLAQSCMKDFGAERFAVIRVGRFTNDERDLQIMQAQEELCDENPDFIMLTKIAEELNKEPEYMNPYVAGHYSAKGIEILGNAAGGALGKYAE
ncbi:MAG: tRNA (guanosine(46)-N7)-methyltransferase TrmB [Oscillospiraceae bacterium]|nr:tRNA (guanosine(46)-N7)-methyltransferase TrmB [Oscillospiraceae bacterium]